MSGWNKEEMQERCTSSAPDYIILEVFQKERFGQLEKWCIMRCPKGHEYKVKWFDFMKGVRCDSCTLEDANYTEWTTEQINKLMLPYGFYVESFRGTKKYNENITCFNITNHSCRTSVKDFQAALRGEKPLPSPQPLNDTYNRQKQSQPEKDIMALLENYGYRCKKEISFMGLKGKRELLRYDIGVYKGETLYFIVEYDSELHFHYIPFFHKTRGNFEYRKALDCKKNEYCLLNGIPLVRVPYFEKDNLSIKMLLPESSPYLVKKVQHNIQYSLKNEN